MKIWTTSGFSFVKQEQTNSWKTKWMAVVQRSLYIRVFSRVFDSWGWFSYSGVWNNTLTCIVIIWLIHFSTLADLVDGKDPKLLACCYWEVYSNKWKKSIVYLPLVKKIFFKVFLLSNCFNDSVVKYINIWFRDVV